MLETQTKLHENRVVLLISSAMIGLHAINKQDLIQRPKQPQKLRADIYNTNVSKWTMFCET